MSRAERRMMVERENPALPIAQQCRLLAVSRSAVYRKPVEVSAEDLAIMALIDRQYLARPYYGSRRMVAWLATQGHLVNRKRVRRLMRLLGLVAIYQRPNTSKPAAAHKIYPYLLSGLAIERVNHVWCSDVTYIPIAQGFLYLVVIMDWVSRAVLAWRISNTLGAEFCVEALGEALSAAMKRAFSGSIREPPTGKISRVSSTRRTFAWAWGLISPISSRNTVPPLASRSLPE
jgi:putative transposase